MRLFHASPRSNRESILKNGLIPAGGYDITEKGNEVFFFGKVRYADEFYFMEPADIWVVYTDEVEQSPTEFPEPGAYLNFILSGPISADKVHFYREQNYVEGPDFLTDEHCPFN